MPAMRERRISVTTGSTTSVQRRTWKIYEIADIEHEETARLILEGPMQRLADAADADRAKALALATGLKEADDARQQKAGERWSPLTRLGIAAGMIASTLTALAIILTHVH